MCNILIVYHSQSGNTHKMAQSVARGAEKIEKVTATLKTASAATVENLLECNGLVLGSPEYFGYMAGMLKDFFDRTYYAVLGKKEVIKKPYAVFISAGNDGRGALQAIERICLGYQFKKIQDPVIARGKITAEQEERCELLGKTIAAGCEAGIY